MCRLICFIEVDNFGVTSYVLASCMIVLMLLALIIFNLYVVLLCDCTQGLARKQHFRTMHAHSLYHQACENQLRFDKVSADYIVAPFYVDKVYIGCAV